MTIGEVVEKCRENLRKEDKTEYGAQGTKEQWEILFDKIEDNDKLCDYVVPKEYYEKDSTGFNSMFVVDPNSKPNQNDAAIFRGTQGAYQWQDNFIVSDGVPISPHQFRARDYVLRLAQDGYRNFDASGHSKGLLYERSA